MIHILPIKMLTMMRSINLDGNESHVSCIVIHQKNKILLHQLRKGTGRGPLGHLGGRVTVGDVETVKSTDVDKDKFHEYVFLHAALRELTEGTGLDVMHVLLSDKMLDIVVIAEKSMKSAMVIIYTQQDILRAPPHTHKRHNECITECSNAYIKTPSRHIYCDLEILFKYRIPTLTFGKVNIPIWYRTLNARKILLTQQELSVYKKIYDST